jgi:glycosyltransferase involved in cell wall biosynthesis
MSTAEVSVIVPTRNRRAMVREAVESVLAQRAVEFELIVIDDGSTDQTRDELVAIASRAACEGRNAAIRIGRGAGRGPAAARNLGLAMATAPMVAFLDSDDLWSPGKLEKQVAFMHAHPEYAISQTGETWIRNGRRVNPARRHLKRAGDIFIDSLRTCLISPSAAIVKTDLLARVGGFDEDMAAAEDYDLWLRVLAEHEAGLLDEPLVTRRAGHPGQLSATVPALDRFRILALAKMLARTGLSLARRSAVADVLEEKCRVYARGLRRRGRIGRARFFENVADQAARRWRHGPDEAIAGVIAAMRAMLREAGMGFDAKHDMAISAAARLRGTVVP